MKYTFFFSFYSLLETHTHTHTQHNGGVVPPRLYSAPGSPGLMTNGGFSSSSSSRNGSPSGSPVSSPRQG